MLNSSLTSIVTIIMLAALLQSCSGAGVAKNNTSEAALSENKPLTAHQASSEEATNQQQSSPNFHAMQVVQGALKRLAWVKTANVEADLGTSLSNNDQRFWVYYNRGKARFPGIKKHDIERAKKHGTRALPGIGDIIYSEQHSKLRKQALDYASRYNSLLLQHIIN